MVDYNMTMWDRFMSFLKPISFDNFSVKVGDWEIFISDSPKKSLAPQVRSGQSVAIALPPYHIYMVGKMGRNRLVYLDWSVLGREMGHCLNKKYPNIIADVHKKRIK